MLALVAFMGRRNPHAHAAFRLWNLHNGGKAAQCAAQCGRESCQDCLSWTAHYVSCLLGSACRYKGSWELPEPEDDCADFKAVCDNYAFYLRRLLRDDKSVLSDYATAVLKVPFTVISTSTPGGLSVDSHPLQLVAVDEVLYCIDRDKKVIHAAATKASWDLYGVEAVVVANAWLKEGCFNVFVTDQEVSHA